MKSQTLLKFTYSVVFYINVPQTFGFDDDEDYEVDDGGEDGIHSTCVSSNFSLCIRLSNLY